MSSLSIEEAEHLIYLITDVNIISIDMLSTWNNYMLICIGMSTLFIITIENSIINRKFFGKREHH